MDEYSGIVPSTHNCLEATLPAGFFLVTRTHQTLDKTGHELLIIARGSFWIHFLVCTQSYLKKESRFLSMFTFNNVSISHPPGGTFPFGANIPEISIDDVCIFRYTLKTLSESAFIHDCN